MDVDELSRLAETYLNQFFEQQKFWTTVFEKTNAPPSLRDTFTAHSTERLFERLDSFFGGDMIAVEGRASARKRLFEWDELVRCVGEANARRLLAGQHPEEQKTHGQPTQGDTK
jgi:hypothetical protein